MCQRSARLAQQRGWEPGTILRGNENGNLKTITITYLSDQTLLAVDENGQEKVWSLLYRDWYQIERRNTP